MYSTGAFWSMFSKLKTMNELLKQEITPAEEICWAVSGRDQSLQCRASRDAHPSARASLPRASLPCVIMGLRFALHCWKWHLKLSIKL